MPRPPKRRRKELPVKTGQHRNFLLENFATLPDNYDNLKKGHVLHVLISEQNNSVTKTSDFLQSKFLVEIPLAHVLQLQRQARS